MREKISRYILYLTYKYITLIYDVHITGLSLPSLAYYHLEGVVEYKGEECASQIMLPSALF